MGQSPSGQMWPSGEPAPPPPLPPQEQRPPLPPWCQPAEYFELALFDGYCWDWKCHLCDKWAGTDEGHVRSAAHKEAVRAKENVANDARRAKSAAEVARRRGQHKKQQRCFRVRAETPQHLLCTPVSDAADQQSKDAVVGMEEFEDWPLRPRPGDLLLLRQGSAPIRLADVAEPLAGTDMLRFLRGFTEAVSGAEPTQGPVLACSEMTARYSPYMRSVLNDFSCSAVDRHTAQAVADLLLRALECTLKDIGIGGRLTAARQFAEQALQSSFVKNSLPDMVQGGAVDSGRAFRFAVIAARAAPDLLCCVQPVLVAACRAGTPGDAFERQSALLSIVAEAGDALAQTRGDYWSRVSYRRLPRVPAPLSNDLLDTSPLPSCKACYASAEEYVDAMYRLLRANSFLSLKRGVQQFLHGDDNHGADKQEMYLYRVVIRGCGLQTHGAGGLLVTATCESLFGRSATSKKRKALLFGSLICLSLTAEAFQDVIWAKVFDNRGHSRQGSEVVLEFPGELNANQHSFKLLLKLFSVADQPLLAAEAPVFFQAHGPVLRALQEMDPRRLPVKGALLGGEVAVEASNSSATCADKLETRLGKLIARGDIEPDAAQAKALSALVRKPLAVVQGPPGTGKTFVGLTAAEVFVQGKKRAEGKCEDSSVSDSSGAEGAEEPDSAAPLLVLCLKNHALDEFLMKAMRFTKNMVRLGGRASDEMKQFNLQSLAGQRPKDRNLNRKLHETIEARNQNRDAIVDALTNFFEQSEVPALVLRYAGDDQLQSLLEECPKKPSEQEHSSLCTALRHDGRAQLQPSRLQPYLSEWLREARALRMREVGAMRREVLGGAQEEESADEDPDDRAGHQEDRGSRWVQLPRPHWEGFDPQAAVSITAVGAATEENVWALPPASRAALIQQWMAAEVEIAKPEVVSRLDEDERLGSTLEHLERRRSIALLRSADIIGCTITGAAIRVDLLREVGIETTITEEAAEILEPMHLAAIPSTTRRLLLIGDHEQLRPLLEEDGLRENGLDISMMERLVKTKDFTHIQLTTQARMREEIAELNVDIYPDLKTNVKSTEGRTPPEVLATPGRQAMFFVNTSAHVETKNEGGHGYKNLGEAATILQHILLFVSEGVAEERIDVLCMYAAQRAHLKGLLRQSGLHGVQVKTIDQSQGDENDIVLVSLTRGFGRFVDTRNRRCVAVSRARCCLVMYGQAGALSKMNAWKHPLEVFDRKGLLGASLPLRCPRHGECLDELGSRCRRRCEEILSCGHPCGRSCHLTCPPCAVTERITLARCGHEADKMCSMAESDVKCWQEITFTRKECGHSASRRCHQPEGACEIDVPITCINCQREGTAKCWLKREKPHKWVCPHPCARNMRCGHPCLKMCGEDCDTGLDACEPCAIERERVAEENRLAIRAELEALQGDDYFKISRASDADAASVEHEVQAYFVSVPSILVKVDEVYQISNPLLRRRFLVAAQDCWAPQDPSTRIFEAATEAAAKNTAEHGFVAPRAGGCIRFYRTATGGDDRQLQGRRTILICSVQFGRQHDCGQDSARANAWPDDGFDSNYDQQTQSHTVFAAARVLPRFLVNITTSAAEVTSISLPDHWSQEASKARCELLCVALPTHSEEFKALSSSLRTNPQWLGVGRDVQEAGRYSRLALASAWRVENPGLWRRYATERQRIRNEIQGRHIRVSDPKIRAELQSSWEKMPGKLDRVINEVRLFHGTKPDTLLAILSNGPNERFSGGIFGSGTYLAEDAGKSDQYVTCDRRRGQVASLHKILYPKSEYHKGDVFYLIVCRAVLGRFVTTLYGPHDRSGRNDAYASERELAYIPGTDPPLHYHSLLAEVGGSIARYREVVQFHDTRLYPEYLLAYQRVVQG